jgi:hypothetical protein
MIVGLLLLLAVVGLVLVMRLVVPLLWWLL